MRTKSTGAVSIIGGADGPTSVYIKKHQMQIVGFSREITLIDYGITNDPGKFVTEICIPVKCD